MVLLETQLLTKHFGGLAAVQDLDLEIHKGEIFGLIGPNGAGKTTAFNVISGFYRPTSGKVIFEGKDISGQKPNKVAKRGITRTFQVSALLRSFSVRDCVIMGSQLHFKAGFWNAILRTPRYLHEEKSIQEHADDVMKFVGIENIKDRLVLNLPHGQTRALGIAMALAADPKLIMLDEPVAGMNPSETRDMMMVIRKLRDEKDITVILVEHHMEAVMALCDRIAVLNYGEKIAEGNPEQIQQNHEVIEAYLGAENVT